ncbi:MAG: polysaccharide pyruvyl transferase family protein, partial [Candidatus Heimdallarchaeaceae archaeon]
MRKVVVAGVVTPRGLGDALQYCVAVKLLNNLLSEADITLMCPDLKNGLFVFKNLNINANFVDLNPAGYLVLWRLLRSSLINRRRLRNEKTEVTKKKVNQLKIHPRIIKTAKRAYEKYFTFYNVDKFISSVFLRSFQFDAGIIGGHTLGEAIYRYIVEYDTISSVVNGPLITSPFSVSKVGLEHFGQKASIFKRILMMKRLRNSLRRFDFIYIRGPQSLEILRDYLGINEQKIGMALDSGFGLRLIHNSLVTSKTLKREKRRIVIVPRKDYFYIYDRKDLYPLYLNTLADFILWLYENFDCEIVLSSQSIVSDVIHDLMHVLRRRGNDLCLKLLQIVIPKNLVEAYELYDSSDMVVTSRMHGGILALSLGVPALFVLPLVETKVLDVLSFLGLDINSFLVDMFDADALKSENIINKIGNILENLDYYKKTVESAVKKALPTLELPVKTLINLLG